MVDLAKDSLLSASPQKWDKDPRQCLGLGSCSVTPPGTWNRSSICSWMCQSPPGPPPLAGPPGATWEPGSSRDGMASGNTKRQTAHSRYVQPQTLVRRAFLRLRGCRSLAYLVHSPFGGSRTRRSQEPALVPSSRRAEGCTGWRGFACGRC